MLQCLKSRKNLVLKSFKDTTENTVVCVMVKYHNANIYVDHFRLFFTSTKNAALSLNVYISSNIL